MIVRSGSPHVDQPFGWRVAEIETASDQAVAITDTTIMTLPSGSVILDTKGVTTKEATVAGGTAVVDVELLAGPIDLVDAIDLATLGDTQVDSGNLAAANAVSLAGASTVNAEVTIGTAAVTVSGAAAIAILAGRVSY